VRLASGLASARMPARHLSLITLLVALATAHGCHSISKREKSEVMRAQNDSAVYMEHPTTVGQLVLHADFVLPPEHRMLTELVEQRDAIAERLKIPSSQEPIHVYLFAEESSYRQYVSRKFPGFPERRAIFVETDIELSVYAHWGEAIAEDLRHELAHGYLHASTRNIPLWLDEGLAEYFEVGRGRHGVNRMHVDFLMGQLAIDGWRPQLQKLEQLTDAARLTQLDYAEAWLWVHFLLESPSGNPEIITEYLNALRNGDATASISERLRPYLEQPNPKLLEHLKSLAPQP
jgi:hypothetical protein